MCSRSSTTDLAFSQQLVSLNWLPSLPITQHGASRRTCSEYVCGAQRAQRVWAITHRTRSETSTMQPIPVPPCHASIYLELFKLLFGGVVSVFLRYRPTIFIATTWRRALFLTSQKFSFQFQPFEIQKFTGSGGSPHQATLSKADFVSGLASRG